MLDYLDRAAPALLRIGRVLKVWALVGLASAITLVVLLAASAWPPSTAGWILLLIAAASVGWAPVAVYFYGDAMTSVAELPAWLRSRPGALSENGEQLAHVYRETAGKWGDDSRLGLVGSGLYRAGKVAWRVGKDIPEFAMATRVVNPALIMASVIGVAWILAVILLLPIVALVALL